MNDVHTGSMGLGNIWSCSGPPDHRAQAQAPAHVVVAGSRALQVLAIMPSQCSCLASAYPGRPPSGTCCRTSDPRAQWRTTSATVSISSELGRKVKGITQIQIFTDWRIWQSTQNFILHLSIHYLAMTIIFNYAIDSGTSPHAGPLSPPRSPSQAQ
jgi:hypothetical protein